MLGHQKLLIGKELKGWRNNYGMAGNRQKWGGMGILHETSEE